MTSAGYRLVYVNESDEVVVQTFETFEEWFAIADLWHREHRRGTFLPPTETYDTSSGVARLVS